MISTAFFQLSRNEQKVLYHLVRYPNLSDRELYENIGMKQSTYSTIKKKLRREGYFYTSYTPILQNLGYELLAVWFVTLNRRTKIDDRLEITKGPLQDAVELFTIISESNQAVVLSMSKNIASHLKVYDRLVQLYEENDFLEDIHCVLFPFDVSSIFSFFNFAPLLNRIFNLESPGDSIGEFDINSYRNRKSRVNQTELNDLEKKVFLGLVRHPEMCDSVLSENIGCSRQVLTRIRSRFLQEKLLKKIRIVSLEKLGFKILAMTHSRFNPLKPLYDRQSTVRYVATQRTPVFNIARDPESVMLTAFRDFEEFKHLHNEFVSFCAAHDSLRGEPTTFLMSIPRLFEVKWLVYEPLVRKMLDEM